MFPIDAAEATGDLGRRLSLRGIVRALAYGAGLVVLSLLPGGCLQSEYPIDQTATSALLLKEGRYKVTNLLHDNIESDVTVSMVGGGYQMRAPQASPPVNSAFAVFQLAPEDRLFVAQFAMAGFAKEPNVHAFDYEFIERTAVADTYYLDTADDGRFPAPIKALIGGPYKSSILGGRAEVRDVLEKIMAQRLFIRAFKIEYQSAR